MFDLFHGRNLPLLPGFVILCCLEKVMKERLLFAAFNCSAIGRDDNFAGMNAAALGWGWNEDEDGQEDTWAFAKAGTSLFLLLGGGVPYSPPSLYHDAGLECFSRVFFLSIEFDW